MCKNYVVKQVQEYNKRLKVNFKVKFIQTVKEISLKKGGQTKNCANL